MRGKIVDFILFIGFLKRDKGFRHGFWELSLLPRDTEEKG